jgi:hypothetical protein
MQFAYHLDSGSKLHFDEFWEIDQYDGRFLGWHENALANFEQRARVVLRSARDVRRLEGWEQTDLAYGRVAEGLREIASQAPHHGRNRAEDEKCATNPDGWLTGPYFHRTTKGGFEGTDHVQRGCIIC